MDVKIQVCLTLALAEVSFMPGRFTPSGNIHRYPLERRLGVPQSRSKRQGKENVLEYPVLYLRSPQSPSPQPIATPTALSKSKRNSKIYSDPTPCSVVEWCTLHVRQDPARFTTPRHSHVSGLFCGWCVSCCPMWLVVHQNCGPCLKQSFGPSVGEVV